MALYGTVPPFQDPEIPIEMVTVGYAEEYGDSSEIGRMSSKISSEKFRRCLYR